MKIDRIASLALLLLALGPAAAYAAGGGGLGTKYCTATNNSTGAPADITASGSSSSSAGNLTLTSSPVPNNVGIFFHGTGQTQVTYGQGYLCVYGGIVRSSVIIASGNVGTWTYDNSDAKHSLAPFIGTTRHFQNWYRDPSGGGYNFSNAVSIAITL
jgi:hypothetical protein